MIGGEGVLAKLWRYEVKVMTGSLHKGGRGGVSQIMTVDDRGEGGGLAFLVRPDDVISGQPLKE